MKKDRINITKDLIPYSFNISLADEFFALTVNYNEKHDFFTVKLERNGETLCEGEPLVYGFPLFGDLYQSGKFPALDIIPLATNGEAEQVTFESLGKTVFLTIDNMGGDDIE